MFGQSLPAQHELVKVNQSVDFLKNDQRQFLEQWACKKKKLDVCGLAHMGHNKQHKIHLQDLSTIQEIGAFYLQCDIESHIVYIQITNRFLSVSIYRKSWTVIKE